MGSTRAGIIWTGAEKVLVYGVTFVQGVILARLLSPEDFGLTAMLGIFLGLGACLAESGLGTALVVSGQRLVVSTERQALKWNVGIAAALYFVLAIAAPGIAAWYGKPILKPLMWAMALGLIINAASVVATARLTRELRFDRLAWVNGASTIAGSCVGILLAYLHFGVWSIVGLGLSGAILRAALAWVLARARNGTSGVADFGSLLSYGWKLTLSGLIHTLYTESYNLIIGKMWSPSAVGLFVRGRRWAVLPGDVVNDTVGRVALPKMAAEKVEKAGRGEQWMILNAALLWPGLVVLWIWAPEIVGLVLGPKWLDCVPYLRILLFGQFLSPIASIALNRIRASGHSEMILKTDAWKKPLGFAALLCGIPFGITGLCWSVVASDVFEAAADVWYARKAEEEVGSREEEV